MLHYGEQAGVCNITCCLMDRIFEVPILWLWPSHNRSYLHRNAGNYGLHSILQATCYRKVKQSYFPGRTCGKE